MLAMLKTSDNPTSFGATVNSLFARNNLPQLTLDDFCPSKLSEVIGADESKGVIESPSELCPDDTEQPMNDTPSASRNQPFSDSMQDFSNGMQDGSCGDRISTDNGNSTATGKCFPSNYRALIKNNHGNVNEEEFLNALSKGSAIVVDNNDVAVNYDKAVQLCSNNGFLPRITEMKNERN